MNSQTLSQFTFLFADLAGFTALTEAHGDEDAAKVVDRFGTLTATALVGDARLVKTIGDAVMIVAGDAAAAVTTALRLAEAAQTEPGFPGVRMGLHLGPVLERSSDYLGATVNLAARVTAFARSGQILCTEAVADALGDSPIATLHIAGVERFKNVSQPVKLFEIEAPQQHAAHNTIDPVCRMRLDPDGAPARLPYGERLYYFCSFDCAQTFAHAPENYVTDQAAIATQHI